MKKKGELIEKGVKVVAVGNIPITINYLISDSGGQGDVYHVTYKGTDYAMKWYCKHPDDVIGGLQYQTIIKIVGEDKKPSEKFIWPLYLVTEENPKNGKQFGYLMRILPKNYYEMKDFLRMSDDPDSVSFKSFNAMLVAGMNIANRMQKLHLKGYSYKDLNPNNFSINPETGDVLVIDNDNVSYDGELCTVKGMKGYMAPEIPRSKYKNSPNRTTDFYSLAVILYQLFFIDHPMDGKLFEKVALCTDEVEEYLYAIKPVFHFDPNNDINRPTEVFAPNARQRWGLIPIELKQLFVKSFTEGIDNPTKRAPEGVWIRTISKCRDKLIRINPEREQFVNFDVLKSIPNRCLGIKINGHTVALYPQKAIYQISVDDNFHKYGEMVAGIVYNRKIDKMMIRNLSNSTWRGYTPNTQLTSIPPKGEYAIEPGVMIEFQRENPRIIGEVFDPKTKK